MKKLARCVLVLTIIAGSIMAGLLSGCSEEKIVIGHLAQMQEFIGQTSDKYATTSTRSTKQVASTGKKSSSLPTIARETLLRQLT